MEILDWAFGKTITGVSTGHTQVQGQVPKPYIELTTHNDSTRVSPQDFTELFEMGLGDSMSICRLKNEQQVKAERLAQQAQIEITERKELDRLQEKYK